MGVLRDIWDWLQRPRSLGGLEKTVTVREGDTLAKLAQRHLGDSGRWTEIWELNERQVPDPDKIYPDQVLRLPARYGRGQG